MRNLLCVCAATAATLFTVSALAAKYQVSPSQYVTGSKAPVYGRSDGIYVDTTAKGSWVITNGIANAPLGKVIFEDFTKYGASKGMACNTIADYGTCAGDTTTVPESLIFADGLKLTAYPIATATIPPVMTAKGLDITGDLTADEGWEVVSAAAGASGVPFITGTNAFYFCASIYIADVDGTDDLHCGFRRYEGFTAAVDDYNDMAALANISGDIKIETIDDNAATTTTDTTDDWTDGATRKLCIYVSAARAVTYTIDGAAPTVTAAFTWDLGDPVIPFCRVLHDTNIAETTTIVKWEQGYTE